MSCQAICKIWLFVDYRQFSVNYVYLQEISPDGQVVFGDLPDGTTTVEITLPDVENIVVSGLNVKVCTEGRKIVSR
jgi:hypothetical protein